MTWLSITLEVEAAQADALSEALIEAGAGAVDLEPGSSRTLLKALAPRASDARLLIAQAARAARMALPEFSAGDIDDADWVRRSQEQFGPLRAGRRLWVVPTWHTPPNEPTAIVVRLDPGLAFGTGSHPSTRLVLARLEAALAGGERVLDYGCGSGILAIAAAKLGALTIDAVDVDPQALVVARENARLNGVDLRVMPPDQLPAATYDLVLANILARPLIELAPRLAARTRSGGRVLLAGILETQAGEVADAYRPQFRTVIAAREDGWTLIEAMRR